MILPAVLRRHPHFGIGGDKELLLCRLDFEAIAGGQDYNDALRRFLTALLTWSENGQVRTAHNLLLLTFDNITRARCSCQKRQDYTCRQAAGKGCRNPTPCWTHQTQARHNQAWAWCITERNLLLCASTI